MCLTAFSYCEGKAAGEIPKQYSSGFLVVCQENFVYNVAKFARLVCEIGRALLIVLTVV